MQNLRYLPNVVSLKLDKDLCIGCKMCTMVCPHGVFTVSKARAAIMDLDGCMECGACAHNCPVNAIEVQPGVGCAAYIIQTWLQSTPFARKAGSCC
jgi:NAD-dependent dihydropyrimidine dehydrogenase PreA subunit